MPNLLFLAVSFGMWIDLEIPVEHISSLTETAASKISLVKDIENQPLDGQWAGVGEAYLLYKRSYDPTNGLIQLENLSKFFTYPPAPHLSSSRSGPHFLPGQISVGSRQNIHCGLRSQSRDMVDPPHQVHYPTNCRHRP